MFFSYPRLEPTYYAFEVVYYALEQCLKILHIMLKLCSLYLSSYCNLITNITYLCISVVFINLFTTLNSYFVQKDNKWAKLLNYFWQHQILLRGIFQVAEFKSISMISCINHACDWYCTPEIYLLCQHYAQCFLIPIMLQIMPA